MPVSDLQQNQTLNSQVSNEIIYQVVSIEKEVNIFLTGMWWSQVPQIGLLVMSLVRWYLDNVNLFSYFLVKSDNQWLASTHFL